MTKGLFSKTNDNKHPFPAGIVSGKISIFAEKRQAMKKYRKTILMLLANLSLCAVVVHLFGNYCFLRTAACPHLYKEYLSGVLVLAMAYVNTLLLFPRFFNGGRLRAYFSWTVVCSLAFSILEMALVFSEVYPALCEQFPGEAVRHLVHESFLVFSRNAAISAFVFCACIIPFSANKSGIRTGYC